MSLSSWLPTVVPSVLGGGGLFGLLFSRKLQKAEGESLLIKASNEFAQSVSEQMARMDKKLKELEVRENECQEHLRLLRYKVQRLENPLK